MTLQLVIERGATPNVNRWIVVPHHIKQVVKLRFWFGKAHNRLI
jgi:hypothetical protein